MDKIKAYAAIVVVFIRTRPLVSCATAFVAGLIIG